MSANYDDTSVLKKASSVITAQHRGSVVLDHHDRSVMNYLLFRAWPDLSPNGVYRLSTKEVMEYAKIKKHKDLLESFSRLCKILLEIDYQDEAGEARSITSHFLSTDVPQSENGMLFYAFDPILFHFIADPKVYAAISMSRLRDLNSTMAMDLYEIMALQYRKKSPVWITTPEDLRKLLKVGDRHPRPDNFRRNVVEKTVQEVNSIAEFDILFEYVRGGQGGAVVEIKFTAVSKSHARLVEAANVSKIVSGRHSGKAIDPKTIDMYDGMTKEERGAPATLTDRAIEGARSLIPDDGNIHDFMSEWMATNRNKVFNDPDAAFLTWLEVKLAKDEDPFLKDLEDDVFGDILRV